MIRRLLSMVRAGLQRFPRAEIVHAYELARMQEDCNRVINDLYVDFTVRLADAEARFRRTRCVDIVEHSDYGLYVHSDGQVSQIKGEVGRC